METYAGIELHSSNNFVGVIKGKDKRLCGKRHPNRLGEGRHRIRWWMFWPNEYYPKLSLL